MLRQTRQKVLRRKGARWVLEKRRRQSRVRVGWQHFMQRLEGIPRFAKSPATQKFEPRFFERELSWGE
jgi:hypothetical protein